MSDSSTKYIVPMHDTIKEYRLDDGLFASTSGLDNALDQLQEKMAQLKNTIQQCFANAGILRPDDMHQLLLKVNVFGACEMSASIGTIDMGNADDWKYFSALLVANDQQSAADDDQASSLFQGTQWRSPEKLDAEIKKHSPDAGFTGYGTAFMNAPVNVSFLQWLKDNGLADSLEIGSQFYLKYIWYYVEDGQTSKSDEYSMIVPCFAEVGAKAGAMAAAAQSLGCSNCFDVSSVNYSDAGQQPVPGFYVKPQQCSVLDGFANSQSRAIVLQDYSQTKTYKLKFKTGASSIVIGDDPENTSQMSFYIDYGNGPEISDGIASSYEFQPNTTYLVAVNLGMVQVIAAS